MDRNSRPVLTTCAGSISGGHRGREPLIPETSSFPIFLHATMPQVPSPDTGEGLGVRAVWSVLADAVGVDRRGDPAAANATVLATQNQRCIAVHCRWGTARRDLDRTRWASLINLSLPSAGTYVECRSATVRESYR